jgi:hypothetical protein
LLVSNVVRLRDATSRWSSARRLRPKRTRFVKRAALALALTSTAGCNGDEPAATTQAPTTLAQPSTTATPTTATTTTVATTAPATTPTTTAPPTVATTAPTTPPTTVDFFETIPDQPELGPDGLPITWIFGRTYEPFENYQVLPPFVEGDGVQPLVDAVLDNIISIDAVVRDPSDQALIDRALGTAVESFSAGLATEFTRRQTENIVRLPNPEAPDIIGPIESIAVGTERGTVILCAIESSIAVQRGPAGDTVIDEGTDAFRLTYEVVLLDGRWLVESYTVMNFRGESECPAG